MKDRLKLLRKELGLTQEKFAERLNIKRNTLANYEIGRNEPIDAVISLICREFNVNETWLRTGEGEMFKERSPSDEIGYYVEDLLEYEGHGNFYDMIIEMMKKYHDLDDKSQIVIQEYFKSAAKAALEREKEGD